MKAKQYFLSVSLLLVVGLVGVLRVPEVTTTMAAWLLGGLLVIGLIMVIAGVSLMMGPQDPPQ